MSTPQPDSKHLTDPSPARLPRGTARPLPSHGFRVPQRPPVVEHIPRRKQETPWGRFRPHIGGEDSKKPFVAPGTVRYCRLADENGDDGTDPEAQQETPIYPTLGGTRLNAEEPPSFGVGARSSASLWLCAQRLQCGSNIPGNSDPERIEIRNRGEKPERVPGELHTLLCEMDFETDSNGGKSIKDLDTRILSDVDVWFKCLSDDSSAKEGSDFDSDDFGSSDLKDESDGSSDDSENECPWNAIARWTKKYEGKRDCYYKKPPNGSQTIGVTFRLDLGPMFRKCKNWVAYVSVPPGQVKSNLLDPGQSVINTGELRVPLGKRRSEFRGRWFFTDPPCKVMQTAHIRLVSEQKGDPSPESPCCEKGAGEKTIQVGMWPGWCEFGADGSSCGTTLLPPP